MHGVVDWIAAVEIAGTGLIFALSLNKVGSSENIRHAALVRISCRIFFLSIAYLLFQNAETVFVALRNAFPVGYHSLFNPFIAMLQGQTFRPFLEYFLDYYFIACLVLLWPFYLVRETERPLSEDKYAMLGKSILSTAGLFCGKRLYWSSASRMALLTIIIKLFFCPLMISWAITGAIAVWKISDTLSWNILSVSFYLTQIFLLIDTSIFAFGYLVESNTLKSEIRSIEPTLLGWVVCLACYPPFNSFAFRPFEFIDFRVTSAYPAQIYVAASIVITVLWGIFAWASIALGFKASNLTNRGIVAKGPYRFTRHPAYTAKLLIWFIQFLIFGQLTLGLYIAFIIVYGLRAWTEERHLARDPEYIAYRKQVRWKCLPGVF